MHLARAGRLTDVQILPNRIPRAVRDAGRRSARLALAALLFAASAPGRASAQTAREDFAITNGTVNAVALDGGTLYLAGSFTSVGTLTGCGIPLDAATGAAEAGFPRVVGQLSAVVSDGAGGWFIGGTFTSVGGLPRANLAHVLADNSVSPWDPGASGPVLALHAFDGLVYAGGTFTSVGGEARNNLAALDAASGAATAWSPNPNGTVRALAGGGATVYAGGAFTTIGGQGRNRIAALDAATGLATAWNPASNSTVRALLLSGERLFAGGDFTFVGGQARNRIAALDTTSGLATSWNPGANAQVASLAAGGGTIYAGGGFTILGGQARNRIAAIGEASGVVGAWNPNANAQVLALAVDGATVYAGGDFVTIGGQARSRIAALDAGTGLATAWDPSAYSTVAALATDGGTVYAGGGFNGMGGEVRHNLAAVDVASGVPTGWNPDANGQVLALAVRGGRVYVGGSFSEVGGATRNNLASLDAASGLATAWDPNVDGQVSALAPRRERLFIGGLFGNAGGQPRNNLAAIDTASGLATAWDPGADGQVYALDASDGVVYAGGDFISAGGQSRGRIAALDVTTGAATPWNPNANGTIRSLVAGCGTIYAGGFFTTIGTKARNQIAALDATTGIATAWNPNSNGPVFALELSGGTIYVGGVLSSIGGQLRNRLAALSVATGLATPWNPNAGGTVRALAAGGGTLYAGGSFLAMGTLGLANLAAVEADASIVCPPIAIAPATIPALLVGSPFSETLVASGGTAPYCWAMPYGSLPPGLTLDLMTGQLGGTPTAPGSYSATVTATDAAGCSGSVVYAFEVSCPAIAVLPASLPDAVVGLAYAETLVTTAGAAPFAWSVSSGALPAGLALHPATGELSGTPAESGLFGFTVSVADAYGCGASESYALGVFAVPPTSTIAANTSGVCLSLQHACATVPVVYTRSESTAVRAMSVTFQLDAARLGLCTPGDVLASIHPGPWLDGFSPSFQVIDHGGGSYTVDQAILGEPCGATTGGTLFTIDLAAVGADGPAAITVTSAEVRDCANLPVGALAGPPASLYVHNVPIVIAPDSLPPGAVGVAYAETLSAAPGLVPFTFLLGAGTLPAGLVLDPGGELMGVPLAFGAFDFTVVATDAGGCTESHDYHLVIDCSPIAVVPASLPNPIIAVPYSHFVSATGGAPPRTLALTSGALPAGLGFDAGTGEVSGTPTELGPFAFTIGATDAGGCEGSTTYSGAVTCPEIALLPPVLPDAVVGVPYSQLLAAGAGTPPFIWEVASGALPAGLTLNGGSGEIAGTASAVGTAVFTVRVSDGSGCLASESYTLNVFSEPPTSSIGASALGLCLSTGHPCVSVPVLYARSESAPVRALSVTFALDPARLALCTPGDPGASIHPGNWLDAFPGANLQVIDHGDGSYTVDQAILGLPCGATNGGTVFSVDVQSVGGDGSAAITVTSVQVRDCDNGPIGAIPGPPASITISHTAPDAIADLAAVQRASGNGTGGTTGIEITWSTGGAGTVELYRAPFGSYPEYDEPGPVSPPDPNLVPGPPWTLVASGVASPYVDAAAPRGFWYYVARVTDACDNASAPSNRTSGTLDYHLGDVSDGVTAGQGDNRVGNPDVSLLGAHYGITAPTIAARGVAYLDVGPTTDLLPTSRPVTDGRIDFEDLMLFSTNYHVVSAPALAAAPLGAGAPAAEAITVVAPSLVEPGAEVAAAIRLSGAGRIQGFSARLAWDPAVVEPVGVRSGGFVESQGGIVLVPERGTVDAALLGRRPQGLSGAGEVARVSFRVLRTGDPGIRIAELIARDGSNRPLEAGAVRPLAEPLAPARTELLAPWPNPVREGTSIVWSLSTAGEADLAIYAVDGRRVRTLASGPRAAGVFHETWSGTDERGRAVAPGVYYAQLDAHGRRLVKRLVLLR